MISKRIALALGIICIVVTVGLAGALAYSIPEILDKNDTISSLTSQISLLQNQLGNLTTITKLNDSDTWINFQELYPSQMMSNVFNEDNVKYAGSSSTTVSFF
jgi:hypothetical protein